MSQRLTAIDLFCGAGGLSEGFRQAGFSVLAGNDFFESAGETFKATHPKAKFYGGPIQDISAETLLSETGLQRGELTCLVGGPPCQAFSVYNHQRGMHDARASLFHEYLRMVEGLHPQWVVMENVTGMLSAGDGEAARTILSCLQALGYRVEWRVLKAEEYGVPQERRRVVFLGNRIDAPIVWPQPTHGEGLLPYVTVWDAIGDLPRLENGEAPNGPLEYRTAPSSAYQRQLRGNAVKVANHQASKLAPINQQRMQHIPEGGSWRDIPHELLPDGMKKARRCDHTKRYGRLRKDGLSSTVLTKCDIHWGAYIHPDQDRSLTVREAARLQSFPDWFEFSGPRTEQYIQVGNAVPPLLGRKIAEVVLDAVDISNQFELAAAE
ncbi:DNA cytosine methyltransferase [Telmatospirillum sp.]|uniref:DNA cytosine methyltransferase n=1 Tax=Telmatospirillum sp. TaxID=2079197 RepID=UPI002851EA83|nr:DNA cytosine methyltransferase [Telmatospirillum sp.]MDR3438032.1 DNA cytosine methyltransferase [Telmatospirillum sp.]